MWSLIFQAPLQIYPGHCSAVSFPGSLPALHTALSACRSLLGLGLCPAGVPRPSAPPATPPPLAGAVLGEEELHRSPSIQKVRIRFSEGLHCTPSTAGHPAHPQHTWDFNGFHEKPHTTHVLGAWFRAKHGRAALDSLILERFSNPNEFMIPHRDPCFHYLMLRALKLGISNSPLEIDLKDKQRKT